MSPPSLTRSSPSTVSLAVSLISAAFVQITAGTIYLFSLYGPQLTDCFNYTQSQTAFIAACVSWGTGLAGPIAGRLVDKHSKRPWPIFVVGGSLLGTAYMLISLTYTGYLSGTSFLIMAAYFVTSGVGSSACYHCALATNLRNWPQHRRGLAVGIPVSFFGLSAFIFASLASLFFFEQDDTGTFTLNVAAFLWFLAASAVGVNAIAAALLRDYRDDDHVVERSREEYDEEDQAPLLSGHSGVSQDTAMPATAIQRSFADDTPIYWQIDFYLLVITFVTLVGIGLMYIQNVGAIVVSLSGKDATPGSSEVQKAQNLHVTLFSLCSFAGRMGTGVLSDTFSSTLGVPRLLWTAVAALVMLCACALMASINTLNELVAGSVLVGLAFGSIWTSTPTQVAEFFGAHKFATHW
ncbi:hypothetical protein SpCBS45565_g01245 [Spizellomyces sp. 'palustris']|nr:hypothetical protein SpCBS45565_g01245 [Spizellomyces sp. 'palustris']